MERLSVVEWSWLRQQWIDPTRDRKPSLLSAAQQWFDWFDEVDRLAVVGVQLDSPTAAAELLGFVVEPALRHGIELIIGAGHALEDIDQDDFVEPEFGYAHSLQRLLWALDGGRPARTAPRQLPPTAFAPDQTQARAVAAGSGVVQIIAPAGSGKTAVLVERVRELLARGAPAKQILAVTFNTAARKELKQRLIPAGAQDVHVETFHSLGRTVLVAAKELPQNSKTWSPTLGQWRRIAAIAKAKVGREGVWLDPPEAQAALSDIKLRMLMRAEQYAETITEQSDNWQRTLCALYEQYEALQQENEGRIDFDDMILRSLLLLREKPEVRERWQRQFQYVLVDEYQDIEPAQELLVRIIAAPQDQLFCVGDEDQTLYAFRRASVERIVDLDKIYPGLQRIPLGINYRCPAQIVHASRTLIEHNTFRFPKNIEPAQQDADASPIKLSQLSPTDSGVAAAQTLKGCKRGEIVVLSRTTDALRPIALACADFGVRIDGPEKLFKPTGARAALTSHLRLVHAPEEANLRLVQRVCRVPGRNLTSAQIEQAAQSLQAGEPFDLAFAGVEPPKRGHGALWAPGELFTALSQCADASEAVALLRGPGGLDQWFQDEDRMGGLDQFECEILEKAQAETRSLTIATYLKQLAAQTDALQKIRDKDTGVELATIHGAKGRQWPHVILVACNEDHLPHKRSLNASPEERQRGEGIEAERRLAYVAFTRATQHLEIHHDKQRPSSFLAEAKLIATPQVQPRQARTPPPPPGLPERPAERPTNNAPSLTDLFKRLIGGS